MAFKEISDLSADTTVAIGGVNRKTNKANPTKVEGYYLGSRQVQQQTGMTNIHFLQTPKGNVGVWGKTDMDRKLGSVKPGTMVKIEFDKMVPSKNGQMYKFKVAIDDENVLDLLPGTGNTDLSGDDNNDVHTDTDDDDIEVLAAAARKAKVDALLNRNKKGA